MIFWLAYALLYFIGGLTGGVACATIVCVAMIFVGLCFGRISIKRSARMVGILLAVIAGFILLALVVSLLAALCHPPTPSQEKWLQGPAMGGFLAGFVALKSVMAKLWREALPQVLPQISDFDKPKDPGK